MTEETYIGLTENTFKSRYSGQSSFKHNDKRNATTLSEHVWKLKDNGVTLKWKIISKAKAYDFQETL